MERRFHLRIAVFCLPGKLLGYTIRNAGIDSEIQRVYAPLLWFRAIR